MKTYSEKLRDSRWYDFRQMAFSRHGEYCQCCGQDTDFSKGIHVHHRRYISGLDPWQYEMNDVMVVCGFCHEEIHEAEDAMRQVIRSMPPWVAREWMNLAESLSELNMSDSSLMALAARTRAIAREIHVKDETE